MILFKSTHFEYLYSGGTTERINLYFTFLKIAIPDRRTTTINDKKPSMRNLSQSQLRMQFWSCHPNFLLYVSVIEAHIVAKSQYEHEYLELTKALKKCHNFNQMFEFLRKKCNVVTLSISFDKKEDIASMRKLNFLLSDPLTVFQNSIRVFAFQSCFPQLGDAKLASRLRRLVDNNEERKCSASLAKSIPEKQFSYINKRENEVCLG